MSVIAIGKSRACLTSGVVSYGKSRVSNYVFSTGKSRTELVGVVLSRSKARQRLFSLSAMRSILQPLTVSEDDTTLFDSPNLSISFGAKLELYDSGVYYDLSSYFVGFNISRRKNEYTSWTLTLQDTEDRVLSPKNVLSALYGKLFIDFYSDKWTLKKWLRLSMLHGDMTWESSKWIITGYKYNSNKRLLTLSGLDRSRHLYTQNQNMDPWEDSDAHTIIGDILEAYEINDYVLEFPNYKIREFNLDQATPIDKIRDILYVGMATWYYRDDVFYAVKDPRKINNVDWIYRDRQNIYTLDYTQSLNDYYNEITLARAVKMDNVCEYSGKEYGFHLESLCAPLKNAKVQVLFAHSGDIILIFLMDDDGGVAQWDDHPVDALSPGMHLGLSGPATQISFTYAQEEGMTQAGIQNAITGYKLRVTGFNPETYAQYGDDPNYTYHYVNTAEQKKYGVWKYPNVVDNTLIPNSEWAEELALWIIEQHSRTKEMVSLKSGLNFFAYPTSTVYVTDLGMGMDTEFYYADSVDLTGNLGSLETTFACSKFDSMADYTPPWK